MEFNSRHRLVFISYPKCPYRLWVSSVFYSLSTVGYFFGRKAGRGVNHSPPSSAEIKSKWSCTSNPSIRLHGVHRGNLACTTFQDFLVSASVVGLYHGRGRGSIVFMTSDMIRVWNEPVVADFNAFYFILSGRTEEDRKNLMSYFWTQFKAGIIQGCEAGTNCMYKVLKFDTNQHL